MRKQVASYGEDNLPKNLRKLTSRPRAIANLKAINKNRLCQIWHKRSDDGECNKTTGIVALSL